MFFEIFWAISFFVGLGALIYLSGIKSHILTTVALALTVVAASFLVREKVESTMGLVLSRPSAVGGQLDGDTVYCVVWTQRLAADDYITTVVNKSDPGEQIRTVRTVRALPEAKQCFSLIRRVPSETHHKIKGAVEAPKN